MLYSVSELSMSISFNQSMSTPKPTGDIRAERASLHFASCSFVVVLDGMNFDQVKEVMTAS
jgi:hypothetical protein